MINDTNIRVSRKDADAIKRIAKAKGWTVKGTVSVITRFYSGTPETK